MPSIEALGEPLLDKLYHYWPGDCLGGAPPAHAAVLAA